MSLVLCRGSQPGLAVKTFALGLMRNIVIINNDESQSELEMSDVMLFAYRLLMQSHLLPDDPRLLLVRHIRSMHVVPGYNTPFVPYASPMLDALGRHTYTRELPVVIVDQDGDFVWNESSHYLPRRLQGQEDLPLPDRIDDQETIPHGNVQIHVGSYRMTFEDFICMIDYVLTNSDLMPAHDPRIQFVNCVKSMVIVHGRLRTSALPIC
ncbi:MAG: hypothetical protein AAB400_00710 [Patescibacteria group bacterium]